MGHIERIMVECYYNSRIVSYLTLRDRFGYGKKRILKLQNATDKYIDDYAADVYPRGFFEAEIVKKGVDLRGFVNSIPSRVNLMLVYGDNVPKRVKPSDIPVIRRAVYTFFAINIYAINKDMGVSIKKINEEYLPGMKNNFSCLAEKGRLTIEDVVKVMIEECSYLDHRYEVIGDVDQ